MGRHAIEEISTYRPRGSRHSASSRHLDTPDGLAVNKPTTSGIRRVPLTVALLATMGGATTGMSAAVSSTEHSLSDAVLADPERTITAPDAELSYGRVDVSTAERPAPPVEVERESPAPVVQPPVVQAPMVVAEAPPYPVPAPVAVPAPVPASGKGSIIAAAALAQIGASQDCTLLATNALRAAGLSFHGWPWEYPAALGLRQVSMAEAMPGDILIYQNGGAGLAHIAVYIGNGQAVHGGWNGWTTVQFSAYVGSGPVAYRVP